MLGSFITIMEGGVRGSAPFSSMGISKVVVVVVVEVDF
jgi:hypothetical protein